MLLLNQTTGTAPERIEFAYFKRVAVMTNASVVVLLVVVWLEAVAFGAITVTGFAFAFTLPKSAAAMVRIMAARSTVLPALSLFMVAVFMVFSFGFGWWFVFRLLM